MSTILAFHAHPDDEVLLTGGTLAAAAAAGHRVVLVTATDGEAGLSNHPSSAELRSKRRTELNAAAAILGCSEVVRLSHPDSGMSADQRDGFAHLPVESVAEELVELLDRHHADVLLGYDHNGGYGHPDHLQVHRTARQAAAMRPAVRLLEATVDRVALMRALRLASRLRLTPPSFSAEVFRRAYSDPADIAYVADVRRFARVKREAMAAHRSQATGGADQRTLDYCRRLPSPVFRLVFGKEWFVDPQRSGELILPDLLGHYSSTPRRRFRSRS